MEENFDITTILEVSYGEGVDNTPRKEETKFEFEVIETKPFHGEENEVTDQNSAVGADNNQHNEEAEVVLGLIPPPDWVENRPLKEGADIELAAAKRLQLSRDNEKSVQMKLKKEEVHEIEAITIDSDDEENVEIKMEEELQIEEITVDTESEADGETADDEVHNRERFAASVGGTGVTTRLGPILMEYTHEKGHSLYTSSQEYCQGYVVERPYGQDVFGCNSCSLSFSEASLLGKHVRCHPPRRKPFCCRVCLKTDTLLANLKRHVRTHSGEKPYNCALCSKAFTSAYSLKIHMRIHTGHKPYNCDQCPRSFYQKTDLNKHTMIHTRKRTDFQGTGHQALYVRSDSLDQNSCVSSQERVLSVVTDCNSLQDSRYTSHHVQSSVSQMIQHATYRNFEKESENSQNKPPSGTLYDVPGQLTPVINREVASLQAENNVISHCQLPAERNGLHTHPQHHSISFEGKQFDAKRTVGTQSVTHSVSSQSTNTLSTVYSSPLPLQTPVTANASSIQSEALSAVSSQPAATDNVVYMQPPSETYYIPLYVNGQLCYAVQTSTSSQPSAVSNQMLAAEVAQSSVMAPHIHQSLYLVQLLPCLQF